MIPTEREQAGILTRPALDPWESSHTVRISLQKGRKELSYE
jgi:hypothetical protein